MWPMYVAGAVFALGFLTILVFGLPLALKLGGWFYDLLDRRED